MAQKAKDAFRTISEAADELDVPQHVLRFWESKFSYIRPMKRAGGRRYYRPSDIELLQGVRALLYDHGYTIRGVQKLFKERGSKFVLQAAHLEPGASALALANAGGTPSKTAKTDRADGGSAVNAGADAPTENGAAAADGEKLVAARKALAKLERAKDRLDAVLAKSDRPVLQAQNLH